MSHIKPRCPWRKPAKHPMDRAHRIAGVVVAALFGVLIGGLLVVEPGIVLTAADRPDLFVWLLVPPAAFATVFGMIAFFFGDRFVDWFSENWTEFVNRH